MCIKHNRHTGNNSKRFDGSYSKIMPPTKTTAAKIPIAKMTFQAHFTQVAHGIRANAKPPMIAPQVGVKRLIKPFAATKIIIEVSTDQFIPATIGETIGEDNPANPEEDGTKKDNPKCNR